MQNSRKPNDGPLPAGMTWPCALPVTRAGSCVSSPVRNGASESGLLRSLAIKSIHLIPELHVWLSPEVPVFCWRSVVMGSVIFLAAQTASDPMSPVKSTSQPSAQQEWGLSGHRSDQHRLASVPSVHTLSGAGQDPHTHSLTGSVCTDPVSHWADLWPPLTLGACF